MPRELTPPGAHLELRLDQTQQFAAGAQQLGDLGQDQRLRNERDVHHDDIGAAAL